MKFRLTFIEPDNLHLLDEDGELVGKMQIEEFINGIPTVKSMTKFQNAKIVVDGKSLKKLQRLTKEK